MVDDKHVLISIRFIKAVLNVTNALQIAEKARSRVTELKRMIRGATTTSDLVAHINMKSMRCFAFGDDLGCIRFVFCCFRVMRMRGTCGLMRFGPRHIRLQRGHTLRPLKLRNLEGMSNVTRVKLLGRPSTKRKSSHSVRERFFRSEIICIAHCFVDCKIVNKRAAKHQPVRHLQHVFKPRLQSRCMFAKANMKKDIVGTKTVFDSSHVH